MASKLCAGLYFAGEVLDVDARTGGYNLQIAWSTASGDMGAVTQPFPEGKAAPQGRMGGRPYGSCTGRRNHPVGAGRARPAALRR